MRHYNFKPGWSFSLGFVLLVTVFVALGVWQLRRARTVEALLELRAQRAQSAPIVLPGEPAAVDDLRYRTVVVEGEYDTEHQFLLDNRVHAQHPGYEVLTPLRIAGGDSAVLVNRGWVPLGAQRQDLPDLRIAASKARIRGVVERFPEPGLRLKGADIPAPGWPAVVQRAVPERLAERLGYPLLPYQVLLAETAPDGYVRAWKDLRPTPEKNRGYALQWFSFALVAAVLYLRHGFKAGAAARS